MATNSGFSLDYDSILRIARAVWEVERSLGIPGDLLTGEPGGPQNTQMVEVNGALSGGLYPAICKYHDGTNWVYSESCFAVDSNSAALTVGSTYLGRRTRSVTDGGIAKSVFTVQASGGGGTGGSTLIIVKLTNTISMTGVQQTYNTTTKVWTDGAITLNLVEINGNTMPVNKRMPALLISGTTYAVGLDPAAVTSVTCAGGSLTVAGRN
jgi:hypothetical protein